MDQHHYGPEWEQISSDWAPTSGGKAETRKLGQHINAHVGEMLRCRHIYQPISSFLVICEAE